MRPLVSFVGLRGKRGQFAVEFKRVDHGLRVIEFKESSPRAIREVR